MNVPAKDLEVIASGMRAFCLAANKHPGGSLSSVEAVTAVYFGGTTDLAGPERRDRFVFSKGHAAAPYYFALWAHGLIPADLSELLDFGQAGHLLPRMPVRTPDLGIDMSTGALGQGLSFACGLALGERRAGRDGRVYALLGDAECTEGQVWEAALTASRLELRTVVALIDANGSGSVVTLDPAQWAPRWRGFGWNVQEVNGHDLAEINGALEATPSSAAPSVIILRTVKGKGLLPPLEGSNELSGEADPWHIPAVDLEKAVSNASEIIRRHFPSADERKTSVFPWTPAAPARGTERGLLLRSMSGHPAGAVVPAKKTGGEIAEELAGYPVLLISPDAIRNSGLLPRMLKVGSWTYENNESNVVECAIAEQDAASLAAGAAAAGLRPVLSRWRPFTGGCWTSSESRSAFPACR
jgi:transketolase